MSQILCSQLLLCCTKSIDQIYRTSLAGAYAATISPELLYQLIKHPMTDIGVKQFELDAQGLYDIEF